MAKLVKKNPIKKKISPYRFPFSLTFYKALLRWFCYISQYSVKTKKEVYQNSLTVSNLQYVSWLLLLFFFSQWSWVWGLWGVWWLCTTRVFNRSRLTRSNRHIDCFSVLHFASNMQAKWWDILLFLWSIYIRADEAKVCSKYFILNSFILDYVIQTEKNQNFER